MSIKRIVAGGVLAGAVALGGVAVGAGTASADTWHHPGPVNFHPNRHDRDHDHDWDHDHDRNWQPFVPGPIFLPPAPPNIFGS